MYYIIVVFLFFFLSFLTEVNIISWDAAIISMSIISATVMGSFMIKEEMKTLNSTIKDLMKRHNTNKKADDDNNERKC